MNKWKNIRTYKKQAQNNRELNLTMKGGSNPKEQSQDHNYKRWSDRCPQRIIKPEKFPNLPIHNEATIILKKKN